MVDSTGLHREPRLCDDCGSSLREDQRYCLGCGAHVGERSPQLTALLRRLRASTAAELGASAPPPTATAIAMTPAKAPLGSGLTLPSPRISTLLVLAFLGFGVIVGAAAGSSTPASSRQPVRLMLPRASASATSPSSSAGEGPASSAASEPPSSASEPTPAAGATPAAAAKTPSSSTTTNSSSSGSGAGGSGEGGSGSGGSGGSSTPKLPPVKHVFMIVLSDQPYADVFGPSSTAPYLSRTLERQGELLVRYYAVAHEQLANGIALVSGQGPTSATAANCPTYGDVAPAGSGSSGQVTGQGCVYPASTETLAGQLTAKHLSWRAYIEGIDEGASTPPACAHPAIGAADVTSSTPSSAPPSAPQPYATFRDPFVYFHSLTDSRSCAQDVVGLKSLSADLAKGSHAPTLAYIAPNRCHDGNATPCAPGAPAGMTASDAFLKQLVPQILHSKAYGEGGLLAITVDEAPSGGEFADSSSCCGQPTFPNLPASSGGVSRFANGGGQVGALLLSPFIKGATTSQEPYNHFSLLRTIEDLFGLGHLGYAGLSKVTAFEPSVFSAYKG